MIIDSSSQSRIGGRAGTPGASTDGRQFTINLAEQMSGADKLASALADFKREAQKSPRERCRDQVMKEWHLTQDTIDSLPPKEAQALNEKIDGEVERRMQCGKAAANRTPTDPPVVDGVAPQSPVEPISTLSALGLRNGATIPAEMDQLRSSGG